MESSSTGLVPAESRAYPSLSDRIQSTFIDALVIVGLMLISSYILESYEAAPDWVRIALFFGIWVIYEPLCISLGCTIGNYFKGIRVRRYGNPSKRINILQALLRYVVKMSLGWISFLTIHTNKERRAFHDIVAGSIVIWKQD